MAKVYADVADAKNYARRRQKRIFAVGRDAKDGNDRQGRPRHGDAQNTSVKIAHFLFASEIPYPEDFVKYHQKERGGKP